MSNLPPQEDLEYWDRIIQSNPHNPHAYVRRGMAHFKLAQIAASIQDFDRAEQLDSRLTPYLWQRGLSYYYAERFEDGVLQFEIDLTVNSQDVEETVWRYLCLARCRGPEQAQATLLPVRNDPRRFMAAIFDLYAGNLQPNELLAIAARDGQRGEFYGHLYLGLYSEAWNNESQAKEHILIATMQYNLDDYMWHLARVHSQVRDWQVDS
ncbi:MAG: tetratricopeptide repeat protein [Leptodesmis sp.]|uniref:tetratricopeptide repeat protein n=1 Tax=Leptodesmis sp. TaxID=3100501 RepID=UPI003D13A0B4